jgi:hypothetical protein
VKREAMHRSAHGWALAILLPALAGCGSASPVESTFGTLSVDTVTSGANQDENAYNLQVTGPGLSVNQTIGLNDRVLFSVAPGSYSARLTDIADNCEVGVNPVNAIVATGGTVRATFLISCA